MLADALGVGTSEFASLAWVRQNLLKPARTGEDIEAPSHLTG
jgi:hypothetical protein